MEARQQQEAHLQQEVQHQAGGTAVQAEGAQSEGQEGEQTAQLTPEEQRKADYKKFKEQYKDLYGEDVKKQVDRRFGADEPYAAAA